MSKPLHEMFPSPEEEYGVWGGPGEVELPPAPPAPPLPGPEDKEAAEKWCRDYCAKNGEMPDFDTIIKAVENGGSAGYGGEDDYGSIEIDSDYLSSYGRDAHGSIDPEFWDKVEIVVGHPIPYKPTDLSCSC